MIILKYKARNKSGVILVTVILLTIVLSIVAIGVLSLNLSQVKTSTSVVKDITAEQLATGLFYQNYQRRLDGAGTTPPATITVGPHDYTVSWNPEGNGTGPNGTNQVSFSITY